MKCFWLSALLLLTGFYGFAQQKTITQIKTELEASPNPPLYVKQVLKKQFVLDTVSVLRTKGFRGLQDSLAYHGKIRKVYGPYAKGKVLLQILAKLPNTFTHVGQIYLDTSVFSYRFADSLADNIMAKIRTQTSTFEDMARLYSMGGESLTKGDVGWVATGAMLPQIEKELAKRKDGEVFKMWTAAGVHIIRKSATKQDTGFALMMRVLL